MFQLFVWCWAGIIIGVSFIATPAKFLAPSIDLQQALDVGRSTFFVLKYVELALIVVLIIVLFMLQLTASTRLLCVLLIVFVAIQYFVVLPVLDARVALILNGGHVPPSSLHHVYVAIEVAKVALLIAAGYISSQR